MGNVWLIYNARLLDENIDGPGAALVIEGKIRAVFEGYFTSTETVSKMAEVVLKEDGLDAKIELYDAHGLTLTPAFIDMHVHMRYPGQTAKEDLNSGLHAAAAGGYGTIVAMPNTNPVVSSVETAMKIEREAAGFGLTHLFQVISLTKDFDGKSTEHLNFIDPKYVPVISEDGRDVLDSGIMLEAMRKAAAKNVIVSCHSEDMTLTQKAKDLRQKALDIMKENGISASDYSQLDPEKYEDVISEIDEYLSEAHSILELSEDTATKRNLDIACKANCRVHIAHVSTYSSMAAIVQLKKEIAENIYRYYNPDENLRLKVTCEVTPHHIGLEGTYEPEIRALVNPPLRHHEDRLFLIKCIEDGYVDVISTDHAPHTAEDKANGAPGFTGLETAFAVCNDVLVKKNGISSRRLSQLMSANPARILGLNKGLLKAGYDADLTLVDPDEKWIVDSSKFYSKGKATPFNGKELEGKVKGLFIDGRLVFEQL